MSVEIKQLKESGVIFYPVVAAEGVIFEDGDNLEEKVSNLESSISNKIIALEWDSNDILNFPSGISASSLNSSDRIVILYGEGLEGLVSSFSSALPNASYPPVVMMHEYYPEEEDNGETYPAQIFISLLFGLNSSSLKQVDVTFEDNNGQFEYMDSQFGPRTLHEYDKVSEIQLNSNTNDYAVPTIGATKSFVYPAVKTSLDAGSIYPNYLYNLGTLTGNVTFNLGSPTVNTIVNHYYWTFDTSSTAPTITWPSGLSWVGGSAPTISASKHYEISVLNSIAAYMEV